VLCGVFVWAREVLDSRKRRFPARADTAAPHFYFASSAWFAWMYGEIAAIERVEAVGQSTFSLADPAGVPRQPTSPIP
jgi:hypothetical protein